MGEFQISIFFQIVCTNVCISLYRDPGLLSETALLHQTVDFTGRHYLVLSLSERKQVWLVSTELSEEGNPLSFGGLARLSGVQALPIQEQPFLVVYCGSGELSLYSGPHKASTFLMCVRQG